MSHLLKQPASPLDFDALYRHIDTAFEALEDFDEIYFIGDHTGSFAIRAASIAERLPNFAGVAVFSVTAAKRTRMAQQLPVRANWGFIEVAALPERARAKKVLLVDFNDTLAGMQIGRELARQGLMVRDFIFALHQLGIGHTYRTVQQERDYLADNLASFIALADRFDDTLSRQTLYARLETYLTLTRRPLIEVSFTLPLFINNGVPQAGLVVGNDDVFIDAGAAHGDTVAQFYDLTGGHYRHMHAFEPDSVNFHGLQRLAGYLPNVTPYFAGLGDAAGEVPFFESPDNRYGSNFNGDPGARVKTVMQIMKLDDVVDEATILKIDVEGFEAKVLKGSANLIRKCKPNLTISAYHYPQDIPELVATLDDIAPYKHMALRHYAPNLWDTQLVLSDRQSFR